LAVSFGFCQANQGASKMPRMVKRSNGQLQDAAGHAVGKLNITEDEVSEPESESPGSGTDFVRIGGIM